jgi:hypothetical protein
MPQIKAADCLTLKMQAVNFLKTSVTIYQETQHHTPADLDLRQHHCDHLKCQSDTDVILWPSTHFTQYEHLQLKTLNQHLSCQEQWNGRLAVICIYLLIYLYIQIVLSRMHTPTHPFHTTVHWHSSDEIPIHNCHCKCMVIILSDNYRLPLPDGLLVVLI